MIKRRLIWLLWLLATGGLYFFENNSGTRIVFAASLLVPLSSMLCALWCADRVRFDFSVPNVVQKGEQFGCEVKASGSVLLAGCIPCCAIIVENSLVGDRFESGVLSVDGKRTIQLSSAYCGSLLICFQFNTIEDRFGLFRFPLPKPVKIEKRVIVRPELQPVSFPGIEGDESGIDGAGMAAGRGTDPSAWSGIREYVPGDPVRQIHWKLSVKTDRMLIREVEGEASEGLLLWLETSPVEADPAAMDQAAEGLLSLSHSLCLENVPHRAAWFDQEREEVEQMVVRSSADFESMQEALLSARSAAGGKSAVGEEIPSGKVIRFDPKHIGDWPRRDLYPSHEHSGMAKQHDHQSAR